MKKIYQAPTLTIFQVKRSDIIATSVGLSSSFSNTSSATLAPGREYSDWDYSDDGDF